MNFRLATPLRIIVSTGMLVASALPVNQVIMPSKLDGPAVVPGKCRVRRDWRSKMLEIKRALAICLAIGVLAGCASSEVTARRQTTGTEDIARPGRIIVHDFAATPGDVPADSAIAGYYERRETPQTAEEIALGRQLGARVADNLVKEILALGMPAERAGSGPAPNVGDAVIMGEFISIDEGSRLKRMLIGFGAGAAELKTLVEGYQVTTDGLRPIGSAEIEARGGKMPGMIVPVIGGAVAGRAQTTAAVSGVLNVGQELGPESIEAAAERTAEEIGKVLSEAFKERGWI